MERNAEARGSHSESRADFSYNYYEDKTISEIFFYLSFWIEVLAVFAIFLNFFLPLAQGILSTATLMVIPNAVVLGVLSLVRIFSRHIILPVLGFLLASFLLYIYYSHGIIIEDFFRFYLTMYALL